MNIRFLDFTDFYSKHPKLIDINNILIPITGAVFDEDGLVIDKIRREYKLIRGIKNSFKRIQFIKYLFDKYLYYRAKNNKNLVIPKKRGNMLCAILELEK